MENNKIQYIELYSTNIKDTKSFYSTVFSWKFTDYGDNYVAFTNSGVEGGFEKVSKVITGGPLIILYHSDLKLAKEHVIKGNGKISKDIYQFPGGKRFHFIDPSGNELAVWSDK